AMMRPHLPAGSPFKVDWLSQKCFDGSCPLGPWIVPASEISDPQTLGMKLWVNDELMQDSNTGRMIFSTAEQIAQRSTRVALCLGALLRPGARGGVGMAGGGFLKPGDTVKLWIEGIGELINAMTACPRARRASPEWGGRGGHPRSFRPAVPPRVRRA